MFQNLRVNIAKNIRPVHLATLTSLIFFAIGVHKIEAQATPLARHAVYSGIFFLCMWTACRLATSSLHRRLALEGVNAETAGDVIYSFVIHLETIKHVVGVCFTLGWIAGVLFCWDYLGDQIFMVPVGVSLIVSLTAFLVTYGFSGFVDNLQWPDEEEQ